MGVKIPVSAELEDGRTLKALVDQRDFARAEGADIGTDGQRITWVRFITWSALSRTKQYSGTWEQFNDVDCVEALDDDQEEPGGADEGLDPGRPAPGGGS